MRPLLLVPIFVQRTSHPRAPKALIKHVRIKVAFIVFILSKFISPQLWTLITAIEFHGRSVIK